MRGTQLSQLRYMLKAEVGSSLTVSTTDNDLNLNQLLSDKQQWLATEYDWPFLDTQFNQTCAKSTRYLTLPLINLERPTKFETFYNNLWQPIDYGVDSREYNYLNSDQGVVQDPVQRWRLAEQIEVPVPTTAPVATEAGAGGIAAGAYRYAVTYITSNGETTISPSVSVTIAANKQVHVTSIPLGPVAVVQGVNFPVVASRNLYRTKVGTTTPYYLQQAIADNVTTDIFDSTPDASLGVASPSWSSAEVTAYEIWSLPASATTLRFTGQRLLSPLLLDTDTADLDDQMLVLFTASDYLMRKKQADGQIKLQAAQARMQFIRAAYPRRTRTVVIGRNDNGGAFNKIVPVKIITTAGAGP